MKLLQRILVASFCTVLILAGCSKNEEQAGPAQGGQPPQGAKKESVVKVPEMVKGKWKAVKISVLDKTTNKDAILTIDIGQEAKVPGSPLSIKVETFLPHFMIEGTALTSQSNEPKNPAVQIKIMDNGKEVHKGWLFSLYPTTHAYQHPKYGFTLVDFIPAN